MQRGLLIGVGTAIGSAVIVFAVGYTAWSWHDVGETGPRGLRGRLLDGNGQPLKYISVASEEHSDSTELDGSFEVRWKPPSTFVDIRHGGLVWRRLLQDDDPAEVELKLARTAPGLVSCRTDHQQECLAEVLWDFGGGLGARMDIECGESAPIRVPGLPLESPSEVRCPTIAGDQAMVWERVDGELRIQARPSPIPVSLEKVDTVDRDACTIRLGDGELVKEGRLVMLAPRRPTLAWSVCGGVPGWPVRVGPRPRGLRDADVAVVLPVSAAGNRLAFSEPLPDPATLHLVRRVDAQGGLEWTLDLEPDEDGRSYLLPDLDAGHYALWAGDGALFTVHPLPPTEVPGTVFIQTYGERSAWGQGSGFLGAFHLEEPTSGATLAVETTPAAEE